MKDQTKRKLSAMVVGKSLVRYRMIATLKNKCRTKLMRHMGKYMTQMLMSQLPLMMKTVRTLKEVRELKADEVSELQIVKEQIVTAALANLFPAITLLNS